VSLRDVRVSVDGNSQRWRLIRRRRAQGEQRFIACVGVDCLEAEDRVIVPRTAADRAEKGYGWAAASRPPAGLLYDEELEEQGHEAQKDDGDDGMQVE
jgi:hypothetical protein